MLNNAIASDPNNGTYYLSLGVLKEQQNDTIAAKNAYKKAVELDSENAYNNLYYGRMLVQEYDALDQAAANMPQNEYNKYNYETMRPILLEAVKYLEKLISSTASRLMLSAISRTSTMFLMMVRIFCVSKIFWDSNIPEADNS